MKIISVLGTASNAGKTTVASYIIRNLLNCSFSFIGEGVQSVKAGTKDLMENNGEKPSYYGDGEREYKLLNYQRGLGALKITVRHEGACPKHSKCDTCNSDNEPYKILTCNDIIREEGKDTDHLSTSGAYKVVWLLTDSSAEKVGINAALTYFDKEDTVVVEGNSLLRVRDVDIAILVASPTVKKVKKSAKILLNKIDIIAINVHRDHSQEQISECKKHLRALGYKAPYFIINPYKEDVYSNRAFIEKIKDSLS